MKNYFRITAYHPTLDISFIIDSVNQYDKLWKFSAKLVSMKCKILAVSDSTRFDNGNIPIASSNDNTFILRACMKGKVEFENGTIAISSRYYKPNMQE